MIRSSRRAAVILSGSALALAGAMLPAQAATTGWRVDATYSVHASSQVLTNIDAVSKADAWAVGFTAKNTNRYTRQQTAIRHWTGKAWRLVTLPAKVARSWSKADPIFGGVGASSPRDVWIFGGFSGRYLRLDGSRWSVGHLPGNGGSSPALVEVTGVKVISSSNVWAFGELDVFSAGQDVVTPYAAHYNGSKWSKAAVPVPASEAGTIVGVTVVSAQQMWAVEDTRSEPSNAPPVADPPVVLEWTPGTGWQNAAVQPTLAAGDQLSTVTAEPGGNVWFGGSASNTAKGTTPLTAEWNGSAWSVAALPAAASKADWELAAMAPDGAGGLWAVAAADNRNTQRLWHLTGATWSQVSPDFGKHPWRLEALALIPHTQTVWGVGAAERGASADGLIAIDGLTPR